MSPSIYPEYPPDLDPEQRKYLLSALKDWSIAHGLAVRPSPSFVSQQQDSSGVLATTAPVTLFPSLFPDSCFSSACSIQTAYNELYSAIARDEKWLQSIVEELLEIDDFVANLWKVHLQVKQETYVQELSLGLFRSDYMVHIDPSDPESAPGIKQVEFNTIASSFGGLSTQVSKMHQYLLSVDAYPPETKSILQQPAIPLSTSSATLAEGLAQAHAAYGPSKTGSRTCVIFLVQDPERNVFDQRHLEYPLQTAHGVRSFRLPFNRILKDTKLAQDRSLLYSPPHMPSEAFEVTVVYFRSGYGPSDYETHDAWEARLHLERSRAIKCPTILTQLAGCKKVQQVLATPHSPHLSRFIQNQETASRVLQTFAPIYPLDESEAGIEARRLATDPSSAYRYVLKPQREGGGNNIYRKAIPEYLKGMPESRWPAYILMEMIEPPAQKNVILRNGELQKGGVICELGVYGVCLWRHSGSAEREDDGEAILQNHIAGYLLRTKGDQSEEGGVAAGFGAVDSCCLVKANR